MKPVCLRYCDLIRPPKITFHVSIDSPFRPHTSQRCQFCLLLFIALHQQTRLHGNDHFLALTLHGGELVAKDGHFCVHLHLVAAQGTNARVKVAQRRHVAIVRTKLGLHHLQNTARSSMTGHKRTFSGNTKGRILSKTNF